MTGKLIYQKNIKDSKSSYWGYPIVFREKKHWSEFRRIFINKGGLPFYAAWKINSEGDVGTSK
mgnify:CR=1 FL=1